MGRDTHIAWTKSTLSTLLGCTKVSAECKNCYMYRIGETFKRFDPYKLKIIIDNPNLLRKKIDECKEMIFVNDMSDTFHKDVPDAHLDMLFETFADYPDKVFQILTKRPERMVSYFSTREAPENCWLGTSVGIQAAIPRIKYLHLIRANITKFVSAEPLIEDLGTIDFSGIDWLIIGGESDFHNPRRMDPQWARSLITQARASGTAVFFKQMGGIGGDGAGGDKLDGQKIQEWPL